MQELEKEKYGYKDCSFKAAGEFTGVRSLVNCFYDTMEDLSEARGIREMHPPDLSVSRDKLTYFLCSWLGGPRSYQEKYGSVNIPQVHRHFKIGEGERDVWLLCMEKAIDQQPYTTSFKTYLLHQLSIPAERVRLASQGEQIL